jgi:hypothetical protein
MPRWVCCFALYLAIQGFSFAFAIAIGLRPSVVLSLYCHVRSARTFGHYRHTQSDMRKTYEKALGKSQGPSSSSLSAHCETDGTEAIMRTSAMPATFHDRFIIT